MNDYELQGYSERFERSRKGKKVRKTRKNRKIPGNVSGHALARYSQRIGVPGELRSKAALALKNGSPWWDLPEGPEKMALRSITSGMSGRLVHLYQGNVYVFGAPKKKGPRDLITVYPLSMEGESDD